MTSPVLPNCFPKLKRTINIRHIVDGITLLKNQGENEFGINLDSVCLERIHDINTFGVVVVWTLTKICDGRYLLSCSTLDSATNEWVVDAETVDDSGMTV